MNPVTGSIRAGTGFFYAMAISKQTLLDNVESAINTLMTGGAVQSYSADGVRIEKMSLSELRAYRQQLMAEIAAESGSRTYARFKNAS